MHARIDQLLSQLDGEPLAAEVVQHIGRCASCQAQSTRVADVRERLRDLPQVHAPTWKQVQERLQADSSVARTRGHLGMAAAAAAVAVSIMIGWLVREPSPAVQRTGASALNLVELPTTEMPSTQIAELVTQSRRLEELLDTLPQRPQVERVSTAATLDTIEHRIQWLDFQLSYAADVGLNEQQAQRLWGERVVLMDSLVKVRYAEAGRLSF
jgi:hypothetical protein